jgi:hypothetical protein
MQSTFTTLRSMLDAVDPALKALQPTASALKTGLSAVRQISAAAAPALAALRAPIRDLSPLAVALRPAAAALDVAFARLLPQAPRFDRMTTKLAGCEFAAQKFFQWTPSVFKFGDAHGAFPRGETAFGAESFSGGTIHDPNLTRGASCTASGGAR